MARFCTKQAGTAGFAEGCWDAEKSHNFPLHMPYETHPKPISISCIDVGRQIIHRKLYPHGVTKAFSSFILRCWDFGVKTITEIKSLDIDSC